MNVYAVHGTLKNINGVFPFNAYVGGESIQDALDILNTRSSSIREYNVSSIEMIADNLIMRDCTNKQVQTS
jgi:hypothetical protein